MIFISRGKVCCSWWLHTRSRSRAVAMDGKAVLPTCAHPECNTPVYNELLGVTYLQQYILAHRALKHHVVLSGTLAKQARRRAEYEKRKREEERERKRLEQVTKSRRWVEKQMKELNEADANAKATEDKRIRGIKNKREQDKARRKAAEEVSVAVA